MKNQGVLPILLIVLVLAMSTLVLANNHTTQDNSTTSTQPTTDIEGGFACLEEKVSDCSSLSTQEVALTILATPSEEVFDSCVGVLENRQENDNWDNSVRDTALAILALNHAGKSTDEAENWLLNHTRIPTELIWFLEQDSNEASTCSITYGSNSHEVFINENKKINKDAGPCLKLAQSNYWLQIENSCIDETYIVECDKDFIATLLYKNLNSPTIYVLEGTSSAPAFKSVELSINSKCFGINSCDYEGTLWATKALLDTGHTIEEYLPYIIALSDSNEQYLPEAFIFMLTNYEDYSNRLIAIQRIGSYWEAPGSPYKRFYDTALALLSVGTSSSEQVAEAKNWLFFTQGDNGCWDDSIRDTAIVLWALEGRAPRSPSGGGSVTYCSDAGYYCINPTECISGQDVGDNFFCAGLTTSCCTQENLNSCSGYGGEVCSFGETCVGNERKATDTASCCLGECREKSQVSECEEGGYSCESECLDTEEVVATLSCNSGGQVCCKLRTTPAKENNFILWIILGIVVLLLIIGWVLRDKLKLFFFKFKSRFKKDKGRDSHDGSGFHPRRPPGRPPGRPLHRPLRRRPPAPVHRRSPHRDKAMSDTFAKLRSMAR